MPNGKPGDHPFTDMLIHNMHPFPLDIEELLHEILELNPGFADSERRYLDRIDWDQKFFDWEAGRNLDEGRDALKKILAELRSKNS